MNAQSKQEFIELYKEAHEPLARFCMVKSYGVMDSKDLLSETVLAAMEGFDKLRNKKAFLSYLFTIASNKVNAALRRRKFSGPYEEEKAFAQVDTNGASDASFDISILYEALNELPEPQKEAVILFEISGFSIKEIMEIQNSGESAVKQRIRRGREKLALLFSEDRRKALAGIAVILFSQNANSAPSIDLLFEIARGMELPISQDQMVSIIGNHKVTATGTSSSVTNVAHLSLSGLSVLAIVGAFLFHGNPVSGESTSQETTKLESKNESSSNSQNTDQSFVFPDNEKIASASMMTVDPLTVGLFNDGPLAPAPEKMPIWDFGSGTSLFHFSPDDTTKHVAEQSDPISAGTIINTYLRECDIEVKIWDKDYVDVQSDISFEAKNEKSKKLANEHLKVNIEKKGNELKISNSKCTRYTTNPFSKYQKWTFANGDKAYIRKVEVSHTIYVPANAPLKMDLAYGNLTLPDLTTDLDVHVFEGKLFAGNVSGKLDLNLRYTDATMKTLANAKLTLFESDYSFTSADDVTMNARYSDVTASSIKSLDGEVFESKLNIETLDKFKGNLRYAKCYSKTIGEADFVIFESKIEAESVRQLKANSRYTDYSINSIGSLDLPQSFEDNFKIQKLKQVKADSKYSIFSIEHLESLAEMTNFEGKVIINDVAQKFTSLTFDGRYTNYDLDFESQSSYELIVDSKFTGIRYPEEKSSMSKLVDQNNTLKLNCYINKSEAKNAPVKFNCFEGSIALAE